MPPTSATQAPAIRVRTVDPADDGRWDEYVRGDRRAGAYHLGAWAEILRRSYGYRPRYLAAEGESGEIVGVLPLLHGRGLMGSRLNSMPVAWSAGPLGAGPQVEAALLQAARRLALDLDAKRLLVKSRLADISPLPDGVARGLYAHAWELALDDHDDLSALWRSEKRLWRGLRKAEKSGVAVRETRSVADLRAFYALYLETMRKHRSLPRSYRQLALSRSLLGPEAFRLFVVEHAGQVIAGGLFYVLNGAVELIYNASAEKHLALRPNHALYAHAIRWAKEQGAHAFDFGGAGEGTSLAEFKQQWGAEGRPVYVYGSAQGTAGDGPAAERSAMPGGERVERLWERVPARLTQLAGALAYRFL